MSRQEDAIASAYADYNALDSVVKSGKLSGQELAVVEQKRGSALALVHRLERERYVKALPDNATRNEIAVARLRQSVQIGEEVVLPSWGENYLTLPNILLRSNLFGASEGADEERKYVVGHRIDLADEKFSLTYTGQLLNGYDKEIYATCIDLFQRDQLPLFPTDRAWSPSIKASEFLTMMGKAYSIKAHASLRKSLLRLNASNLRIRRGRQDVPAPMNCLVQVAFDDGLVPAALTEEQLDDVSGLRSTDIIRIRLPERTAYLYGIDAWSRILREARKHCRGLALWLADYYATHREPYPIKVADLKTRSRYKGNLSEFRRALRTALIKLQSKEMPEMIRLKPTVDTTKRNDLSWINEEDKVELDFYHFDKKVAAKLRKARVAQQPEFP
jgi:hypothetical protein